MQLPCPSAATRLVRRPPNQLGTGGVAPTAPPSGLVRRLVAEHLDPGTASYRLDRLARIGVDEIAYRKGRKFRVVWVQLTDMLN